MPDVGCEKGAGLCIECDAEELYCVRCPENDCVIQGGLDPVPHGLGDEGEIERRLGAYGGGVLDDEADDLRGEVCKGGRGGGTMMLHAAVTLKTGYRTFQLRLSLTKVIHHWEMG